MIVDICSSFNEKVEKEIAQIENGRQILFSFVNTATSAQDYIKTYINSPAGREYAKRTDSSKKLKVLDIGFGNGESSLHLALQGHDVFSLEPSSLNCELLYTLGKKFNLPLTIYKGVAEDIEKLDQEFDLCVFSSSLHHCDDPVKALKGCFAKLKKGGKLVVVNEPLLKWHRSKKWFYQKLESDPASMGHYGGNEHIYYFQEYVKMIRQAGFKKVSSFLQERKPRLVLADDLPRAINGVYTHSDRKLWLKFTMLLILNELKIVKGLVTYLGKTFSLLPFSFEAWK